MHLEFNIAYFEIDIDHLKMDYTSYWFIGKPVFKHLFTILKDIY